MEESVEWTVRELSSDEDIVELGSITETSDVTDDVTDITRGDDPEFWEKMTNVHVSNGENETVRRTSADTERLRRQRRLAMLDVLQTAVDDTVCHTVEEWERIFRVREELLDSGILDLERAAGDGAEGVLDLWAEALSMTEADNRRVLQECQVCLEMAKLDERACCGLAICVNCIKKYVETQLLEAGVVRIGCPNPACTKFLFQEEIRELLRARPELRDRYDRWVVDMNADPRRKTCPRCCRITDKPITLPPVDRQTAKYGVLVDCLDCQLRWCFSCQAPWHHGLTCAKNRAGDQLLKKWARQKTHSVNNAHRCPRCKVYIQRASGCDHMKCSRCKTKFCYRCGGRRFKIKVFGYRLEDHDKKYSIIGCNDRFNNNKRLQRIFTRGGIFGAKVMGGLVAVPVVCGIAGVVLTAAMVAAPLYGVYRLAKRVRRPPIQSPVPPRYGPEEILDLDSDGEIYTGSESSGWDTDSITSGPDIPSISEYANIEHMEDTLPPPIPPRQPIYRVVVEPRTLAPVKPPADADLFHVDLVEDVDIEAVIEGPVLPPPVPTRSPKRTTFARRPPPAVPPPSHHDAVTNQHDLQESVSSETVLEEVTYL